MSTAQLETTPAREAELVEQLGRLVEGEVLVVREACDLGRRVMWPARFETLPRKVQSAFREQGYWPSPPGTRAVLAFNGSGFVVRLAVPGERGIA